MAPLISLVVRSCLAVALLAGVVALAGRDAEQAAPQVPAAAGAAPVSPKERTACPPGTLPDDGVCLPVPAPQAAARQGAQPADVPTIELLPDRAESYLAYELPVTATAFEPEGTAVLLRTGARAEVRSITLEHQAGPASRLDEAKPSARVLTLHTVRRADALRRYIVALEPVKLAPRSAQSDVPSNSLLGEVETRGGPGGSLRLSVRQLRQSTDPTLPPDQLLSDANSIRCDPRNVLSPRPE
jgi:hypothetical protein